MSTGNEYYGWSLYDKVIIVTRQGCNKDDIDRGYVVDPKNKASLNSARKWGFRFVRDENGIYAKDKDGNYIPCEPEEYLLDNKDFTVKLWGSAEGSCQGGKLSFWNCIIGKDGKEWLIGINSELLLHLLMQSTCINGEVQEKVSFARQGGNVGLLHSGMLDYKQAINDNAIKQTFKKKTSKHEIGTSYASLTCENIYISKIYQWYEVTEIIDRYNYHTRTYTIKPLETPNEMYIFPSVSSFENSEMSNTTSMSELFDRMKTNLDNFHTTESIGNSIRKLNKSIYPLAENWNCVAKLPARKIGNIHLVNDIKPNEYDSIMNQVRHIILDKICNTQGKELLWNSDFNTYFGSSSDPNVKPSYTEEQQAIIRRLFRDKVTITF